LKDLAKPGKRVANTFYAKYIYTIIPNIQFAKKNFAVDLHTHCASLLLAGSRPSVYLYES